MHLCFHLINALLPLLLIFLPTFPPLIPSLILAIRVFIAPASATATAAAETAAAAAGAGILGFALGDKVASGACKYAADYAADFAAISAATDSKIVRVYAASDCDTAREILPAAKGAGFKVVLGIWPDTEISYQADKAAVVQYGLQYADQVYAVTVGSETLYRGNFTGEQLLAKIQDTKAAVPGFKVGTADSWNKYQDGTANPLITGNVDILLINAFSYWQGQTIENATANFFDDIAQAIGIVQDVSGSSTGGPEIWIGETGWPTAGTQYQAATPSTENAATFWSSGVCGMLNWGVNVFYFEAFDEPWKPVSIGDDGSVADETHWGSWTADRVAKFTMTC